MEQAAKIYAEPLEVAAKLRSIGLTSEILRAAITAGELERVSCTDLDPLSYPGTSAWGHTVRHLRRLLLPLGWRQENPSNLALIVEPVRRIAIAVTAGSRATGIADLSPTTKHQKGPMIQDQVLVNRRQLLLFKDDRRFLPTPRLDERLTWLLLVRAEYNPRTASTGDHIARCELSLPAEINEDGFVIKWWERIILEPVRLDQVPAPKWTEGDLETEFDVPVRRR